MHRRQLLRRAVAVGALGTATIGTTTAAEPPSRPDHLENVGDDPAILERFQPSFITNYATRTDIVGVFGWHAESSEYPDLRATYYWTKYPTQNGSTSELYPVRRRQ